ncbi:MAG: tyrosine-type recombinase/integrase [Spirochaetales bacterium]|nr:tyrosine-type recombinase/integrase [Spirochaetales bacterium]
MKLLEGFLFAQKVLEANGIDWREEGLSFHSFRHFFNTRLVANGVNGELVRATVGHESSDMTKHYLHLVPSDLNRVMDVARQIVNLQMNYIQTVI